MIRILFIQITLILCPDILCPDISAVNVGTMVLTPAQHGFVAGAQYRYASLQTQHLTSWQLRGVVDRFTVFVEHKDQPSRPVARQSVDISAIATAPPLTSILVASPYLSHARHTLTFSLNQEIRLVGHAQVSSGVVRDRWWYEASGNIVTHTLEVISGYLTIPKRTLLPGPYVCGGREG